MDMKKIGIFLKSLRKEKGLTQEQLAEKFGVAGRTVSRWENATNMPDLSMLILIAEFFNVEVKEILNGERQSENMNQELKETLEKVADYNTADKEKRMKIFLTSFLVTIIIGVITLNVELIIFMDYKYILGEAIILLIGSITAIFMTVKNGLWGNKNKESSLKNDMIISSIMSAIFSCVVALFVFKATNDIPKTILITLGFFFIIYIIGFLVLRLLSVFNAKKKKQ